jgi:hypothetical protein
MMQAKERTTAEALVIAILAAYIKKALHDLRVQINSAIEVSEDVRNAQGFERFGEIAIVAFQRMIGTKTDKYGTDTEIAIAFCAGWWKKAFEELKRETGPYLKLQEKKMSEVQADIAELVLAAIETMFAAELKTMQK